MQHIIADTYRKCREALEIGNRKTVKDQGLTDNENFVREIYAPFTVEDINQKIVEILRPCGMQTPVELVFQTIEGLHKACPHHPGDWYFTGHYPTPGGICLVNQAFVNYVEQVLKLQL